MNRHTHLETKQRTLFFYQPVALFDQMEIPGNEELGGLKDLPAHYVTAVKEPRQYDKLD